MLDVTYETVEDLLPGRLAKIDEDRGKIRVRLDGTAPLPDVVRQLNIEIRSLMSSAHWFQLWRDEIVSRDTPDQPLSIEYILHANVPPDMGVGLAEDKGAVRVYICPSISTREFATWMNPATEDFLAGGCWFQLYAGEIIDNSPEPNRV
ncbi:hypothetical protein [Streptomyces sp. cmx-10-25]|uniref:hypothetical protein n=1 Tax=Streptomyces sp. cmx-10-25 TaxID=2790919 RepID=UPI003980B041